ncbi:D-alanine--D-alanine ligase family protein [Gracilimonas mengyeensis]|uniref:D-alanine--D-alanine ligase n=1 Tax=Gracilimonas mengyeensis TaxID=1302730 RepID=A0A521BRX9_9BACT|nr:D-alanine--D-alanine ligase family protein [Gracilimonas mengyeensis]SMO49936.1 D-alanine--D-alanine ligase [Gracilimonas mengyeensis]
MSQKNLIVAFGGVSPEHEVSVLTAIQAISALEDSAYNCIPLYVTKSGRWLTGEKLLDLSNFKELDKLEEASKSCAFVKDDTGKTLLREQEGGGLFSKPKSYPVHAVVCAFHGSEGENGSFQGVCEMMNIPYTGSGVLGSSVGMNKVKAKLVAAAQGVPVTRAVNFYESDWQQEQEEIIQVAEGYDYPLIVKPVSLGSSIGVAIANDREELINAVETAFRYDAHLLIEEAINPLMEINCSVIGTPEDCRPSVCEKPLGKTETLSFEDKYQSGEGGDKGMASADRVIPADISSELTKKIQNLATKTFSALNASGLARLDFLVNANTEEVYFNEINTIPGSFSFYLWEETDLPFDKLLEELVDIALKQHQAKNGRVRSYDTNLLSEKAMKGIKGLKGSK